jgi:hypothetical protein
VVGVTRLDVLGDVGVGSVLGHWVVALANGSGDLVHVSGSLGVVSDLTSHTLVLPSGL